MSAVFATLLGKLIRTGNLEVQTADGVTQILGDRSGPQLGVKLTDRAAELEFLINPALAAGELYMDGRLVVTRGDLYDVLALGAYNLNQLERAGWLKPLEAARVALRRIHQRNNRSRARRNVEHHYDLDVRLYDLFLDSDRQYSCAYFEHPGATLEEAQLAKKRHLASKLLVEEGQSVLDIGSGFGGMALYLAQIAGARATGVTLSKEQYGVAAKRAADLGLQDRVEFRVQDYRDVNETFDRIVSVGMFEHVGVGHFDEYFGHVRRLLKDDGAMELHAIGRNGPPGADQPLDREIHLPRRLYPEPLRSPLLDRAVRALCHRHRDPAPALRGYAESLAQAVHGASRGSREAL